MILDRRKDRRYTMNSKGQLVLPAFETEVACRITDISSKGARAELDIAVPVNTAYKLYIRGADDFVATRTKWQFGKMVGLEFSNGPAPSRHR